MGNKLYVGNLPYSYRDSDMEQAFSQYGTVSSAKVMMERDTGRSKGFGFVEMSTEAEAKAAIEGMNGQQVGGRGLVVNEARPMESRPPRSGGFGGGGGGVVATAVVAAAAVTAAVARVVKARRRRRSRRLLSSACRRRAYGPFFHACATLKGFLRCARRPLGLHGCRISVHNGKACSCWARKDCGEQVTYRVAQVQLNAFSGLHRSVIVFIGVP